MRANYADATLSNLVHIRVIGPPREDVRRLREDFDFGGLSYLDQMIRSGRGRYPALLPAALAPFALADDAPEDERAR